MTLRRDISIEYWKTVELKGAVRLRMNLLKEKRMRVVIRNEYICQQGNVSYKEESGPMLCHYLHSGTLRPQDQRIITIHTYTYIYIYIIHSA